MTDKELETACGKAQAFGYECGTNAGSWMLDGNSSLDYAQKLLDGIEDGDPIVMDLQPSPLSGEWADGLTFGDVYRAADFDPEDTDAAPDILDAFELGFGEGFWDEVARSARAMGATR
jgi:hypothetical protein